MPESGAKSHPVNNGKGVESISPHQSAWLTRWTGTKLESSTQDHLSQFTTTERDHRDIKKQLSRVEVASDNFGFFKDIKNVDLTMSLKKPTSQSFPFFKHGQEQGETRVVQALGPQVSHEKLTTDLKLETSSRECHLQPTEQVKYHMFFGESSPQPSDDGAYKLNGHTTHGPENFCHLMASFASKEHLQKSEKSELPSFLRQHNTALLEDYPSTSSHHSPAFMEEQYKRMQKHIGMGFFPQQTGSPQTVHHGSCLYPNGPHFVHDVEMARMSGDLHSFSRTTHSLLITKQTDVKVYQESQIYRESRVSSQLKEEALRELNCISPHFFQGQRGLKIQLLDSSDHESQENVEDVKAQKNESSADTDAMDMEAFKEKRLSGVRSSPPNKDIMMESNLPLLPSITLSTEKDTCKKRKIELPDINLEISALPAASSSTDKAEPCTSRTQSLDMNTLHFNLDRTSNSRSDECSNSNPGFEPGNRWIMRLKLNASNSLALGSKISKLVEPSFQKPHGKKSESLIGESSLGEAKRECKDITLSHIWIQRWSHNQYQKNVETVETCKPENSKFATEELQKKQFPSIAAMALMGKAMTGFQQCKFQKKESFVVWNTKAFEE